MLCIFQISKGAVLFNYIFQMIIMSIRIILIINIPSPAGAPSTRWPPWWRTATARRRASSSPPSASSSSRTRRCPPTTCTAWRGSARAPPAAPSRWGPSPQTDRRDAVSPEAPRTPPRHQSLSWCHVTPRERQGRVPVCLGGHPLRDASGEEQSSASLCYC